MSLQKLPSRRLINDFTEDFFEALLPMVASKTSCCMEPDFKESLAVHLANHIHKVLPNVPEQAVLTNLFFEKLQPICRQLRADAELILQFDPAAYSLEEVLVTYPGFMAIAIHRVSHELYKLKVPILPRMMSEWAHSRTGIDINPGATIGHPFFIDHGTGVVIGETTVIGHNVKIYQGVTLGALNVRKEDAQSKRHPTIEDNVVIYANSTILGGNTLIGHDSIIGGNTWITESIQPFSVVYHQQDQVVTDRKEIKGVINWVI